MHSKQFALQLVIMALTLTTPALMAWRPTRDQLELVADVCEALQRTGFMLPLVSLQSLTRLPDLFWKELQRIRDERERIHERMPR
jgi:hypothetical protein